MQAQNISNKTLRFSLRNQENKKMTHKSLKKKSLQLW